MRSDIVYKRAFNDALAEITRLGSGAALPSETVLARSLGVSRTTVRKVLVQLKERQVLLQSGTQHIATGNLCSSYPDAETVPVSAQVERQFMEWMLRGDTSPGHTLNELDLARQFGVATTSVREFLNRFQRFGLIERRPGSGWVLRGFTEAFALELFEIRELFELRSARAVRDLPKTAPIWPEIARLRDEHLALLNEIEDRFHDFSDLDSRFHRLVNTAMPNRFIDGFYDVITLIFHYHYQWNKRDERQRNAVAIAEHLDYIDALQSRNLARIERACRAHLASARHTLMRSIRP